MIWSHLLEEILDEKLHFLCRASLSRIIVPGSVISKENNPFYHDISINVNDIPNELKDLTELDDDLPETNNLSEQNRCVKSVETRSFFWSEYRKSRTRKNSVFGL